MRATIVSVDEGRVQASPVLDTPAVVLFGDNHIAAGEVAMMTAGAPGHVMIHGIKRLVGRQPGDDVVNRVCAWHGVEASLDHEGGLLLRGDDAPDIQLSDGLRTMFEHANDMLLLEPESHPTVVVVPDWYEPSHCQVVEHTLADVDIEVLQFIEDTTAIALWMSRTRSGTFAIVDVGAGGVTASIIKIASTGLEILSTTSTQSHGGEDLDAGLADSAIESHGAVERQLVRHACESMKRQLQTEPQVSRRIRLPGGRETLVLERWQLDLLLSPLMTVIERTCRRAFRHAGAPTLDGVVAAGGCCRLPHVKDKLKECFECEVSGVPGDLDAAVLGAAMYCATLKGLVDGLKIVDKRQIDRAARNVSMAVTRSRKQIARHRPVARRGRSSRERLNQLRNTIAGRSEMSGDSTPPPSDDDRLDPLADGPSTVTDSAPDSSPSPDSAPAPDSSPSPDSAPAPDQDHSARSLGELADRFDAMRQRVAERDAEQAEATARDTQRDAMTDPQAASVGQPFRTAQTTPDRSDHAVPYGSPTDSPTANVHVQTAPPPVGYPVPSQGSIVNPTNGRAALALAMTGQLMAADVYPIALPVLLRRLLAQRSVTGTLTIESSKHNAQIIVRGGTAELSKTEHSDLQKTFELSDADFYFSPEVLDDGIERRSHALPRLAVNALRVLLRNTDRETIGHAFADRLTLSPVLRPDRRAMLNWLRLPPRDRRFIERQLDGTTSAQFVLDHGGMSRAGAMQLLALLSIFDIVAWKAPVVEEGSSPAEKLEEKAHLFKTAHYFDVLGVHFSALSPDLKAAYQARLTEYEPGSQNDKLAPAACQTIRQRVEEAHACLLDPNKRSKYRRKTFPDYDWTALSQLEAQRSESLAMRGAAEEALVSGESSRELMKSAKGKGARRQKPSGGGGTKP